MREHARAGVDMLVHVSVSCACVCVWVCACCMYACRIFVILVFLLVCVCVCACVHVCLLVRCERAVGGCPPTFVQEGKGSFRRAGACRVVHTHGFGCRGLQSL